jgi:alcohol dehydrogenase class IV
MFDKLMNNPTIKGLAWFVSITSGIAVVSVGAAFGMDERYSLKTDVVAVQVQADKNARDTRKLIEYQADLNRKRQIEDNLFQYNLKQDKQKTQADRAMAERYKQERQDLIERWMREGQPLK